MKYQFYILAFLLILSSCSSDDGMAIDQSNSEFATDNGGECFLFNAWSAVDNLGVEDESFSSGTFIINLHEGQQLTAINYNGNEFYFPNYNAANDEYCVIDNSDISLCSKLYWNEDTLNFNFFHTTDFVDFTIKANRVMTCDSEHIKNLIPNKFLSELNEFCFQSSQIKVKYLIDEYIEIENHPNSRLNGNYNIDDDDTFTRSVNSNGSTTRYKLQYKYENENLTLNIEIENSITGEDATEVVELINLVSCM